VKALTKEVRRLTVELEKYRHPPHIVGSIIDMLPDGRLVIKSSTGPNFVVKTSDVVNKDHLEVGTRVSLAQNNLTVVG
ncbi:MAG: proteasome-activating nucleotidase, partial [Thermoplasmatota archaeon]